METNKPTESKLEQDERTRVNIFYSLLDATKTGRMQTSIEDQARELKRAAHGLGLCISPGLDCLKPSSSD